MTAPTFKVTVPANTSSGVNHITAIGQTTKAKVSRSFTVE